MSSISVNKPQRIQSDQSLIDLSWFLTNLKIAVQVDLCWPFLQAKIEVSGR